MSKACQVISAIQDFYQSSHQQDLWVGFSGGLDSTVLLDALVRLKPNDVNLNAIHIHHGLQADADRWLVHCKQQAEDLQVNFIAKQVVIKLNQNLEAAARQARYQAFNELVGEQGVLLTAHHQRDQAETFILNLMRGAGLAGLAAMPTKRLLNSKSKQAWLYRPLLNIGYSHLVDYAHQHGLSWVEDPMNQQLDFRRNYVRHQLLPLFDSTWSQAQQKISQAASHCFESNQLLEQLAQLDLKSIDHSASYLDWQALQNLDWARQKNSLRYWFHNHHSVRLTQTDLDWFKSECFSASSNANPQRIIAGKELRRFKRFVFYPVEKIEEINICWSGGIDLSRVGSTFQASLGKALHTTGLMQIIRSKFERLNQSMYLIAHRLKNGSNNKRYRLGKDLIGQW